MPITYDEPKTRQGSIVYDDDQPSGNIRYRSDEVALKIPFMASNFADESIAQETKDAMLDAFNDGFRESEDKGHSWGNRFKQNLKDSFYGINGVGS